MKGFNSIIANRRSIRKFQDKPVPKEMVQELLKAALLAPSGKSTYPCDFIAVDKQEILASISQAKEHGAKLVKNAPLAIVITADKSKYDIWVEDAAIASTLVMLQAENLGLGCCWVQMRLRGSAAGKTATENLKQVLNLPDDHEVLAVLAIGYADETKEPHGADTLKTQKLHMNKFGQLYNL